MSWTNPPDFDEVRDTLTTLSRKRTELRAAELELQVAQVKVNNSKPGRKAAADIKLVGYDDNTEAMLANLRSTTEGLRASVEELEANVKFFEYWKEMFKALSYRGRV